MSKNPTLAIIADFQTYYDITFQISSTSTPELVYGGYHDKYMQKLILSQF